MFFGRIGSCNLAKDPTLLWWQFPFICKCVTVDTDKNVSIKGAFDVMAVNFFNIFLPIWVFCLRLGQWMGWILRGIYQVYTVEFKAFRVLVCGLGWLVRWEELSLTFDQIKNGTLVTFYFIVFREFIGLVYGEQIFDLFTIPCKSLVKFIIYLLRGTFSNKFLHFFL